MCGRFSLQIPPKLLAELFGLAEMPVLTAAARYNVAPTQEIPVIRQYLDSRNRLDFLRWGLIPSWLKELSLGKPLVNARCETIVKKATFRQAIKYRRCLIPASGFYQWEQEGKLKKPFYIRPRDGSPMVFAGIWESWRSPEGVTVESCAILTTSSNSLVAPLHDRQPVILHPTEYHHWLDRTLTDPEQLKRMYQPYPADLMEMYPVATLVNSTRNDSPELIASILP